MKKPARYHSWEEAHKARVEACRCAATVLAGRPADNPIPLGWSLAVFFESYIAGGSAATEKAFGPKKPAKLKVAKA